MTRTLRIAITNEDIDTGDLKDPCKGPVSLAGERAMPGAKVEVGSDIVEYGISFTTADGQLLVGVAPPEVREFVRNFEEDGWRHLCSPVEFELELRPATGPADGPGQAAADQSTAALVGLRRGVGSRRPPICTASSGPPRPTMRPITAHFLRLARGRIDQRLQQPARRDRHA